MEVYTSDSCDSDAREQKTLNFSRMHLTSMNLLESDLIQLSKTKKNALSIETILLDHNLISYLPLDIENFCNLKILDLSSNCLTTLPENICQLPLNTLIIKNNLLTNKSLPKCLSKSGNLKEINLSGNMLTYFPDQVIELKSLKYLYLGGNKISNISNDIWKMSGLQILSMGGNLLTEVPESVGNLCQLQALVLFDNLIENLPTSIAKLKNLNTLLLHKNRLKHLPTDIIALKNLTELSLRDNPLVVRFVQDMTFNPPSLKEIAARTIKVQSIKYTHKDLPTTVHEYLKSANCCVNPNCKGVFFDNRVEHIKFVDFCGKYRVPLLQYLCSSKCIEQQTPQQRRSEPGASGYMMRKVLLG